MLGLDAGVHGARLSSSRVRFVSSKSHPAVPGTWIINFTGFKIVYIVECVFLILREDVRDIIGLGHNGELSKALSKLEPKITKFYSASEYANFR